jgi:replicative DNA helicase
METDILLLLSNLSNYKRFNSLIREERLTEDIRFIYRDLNNYFNELGKSEVDWLEYKAWLITLKHPQMTDERIAIVDALCDKLHTSEPVNDNATMTNLSTRYWANQISETAYRVVTGDATMEDVKEQLREYNLEVKGVEWDLESLSLSNSELLEQLQELRDAPKYSWSIPELELMLGPVSKGDFLIVGARPDGGKTTFLATQAVHFASQLNDSNCVLWCNNEESASRIRLRQTQAALNWTREEVMKDLDKSVKLFEKKVGVGKIQVMDNTSMTVFDIEAAIQACNPRVIIIDQIWKVGGFEKQTNTAVERYAKLAQYIRELAKHYGPVIGASQLDGTADNAKYPLMGTLYGSKTAVQGEADAIVTIGQSADEGADMRFLRAPKNKLSYADNEFRSAGCAVKIDKERAQIISLLK